MDTIQAPGIVPMGASLPKKGWSMTEGGALAAWVTPDLALSVALVTMFSIFAIFHGSTGLFADTDSGWHIRNGERMIATGSLSRTDPYSFSKPGQPWVSWEWGADVLMGSVYLASGLAGIAVLYALCIGASVWTWFRLNRAFEGNFLIAGLFFVPMLATTSLHWLARPHIFSWLFLLRTIWMCERMPQRPGWRYIALAAAGRPRGLTFTPAFSLLL
jgi:hypothetical protein